MASSDSDKMANGVENNSYENLLKLSLNLIPPETRNEIILIFNRYHLEKEEEIYKLKTRLERLENEYSEYRRQSAVILEETICQNRLRFKKMIEEHDRQLKLALERRKATTYFSFDESQYYFGAEAPTELVPGVPSATESPLAGGGHLT